MLYTLMLRQQKEKLMLENTAIRTSKEEYELNLMFGKEPSWEDSSNEDENFKTRIITALNWANAVLTTQQLKAQTIEYLIANDLPLYNLESLEDYKFTSVGKTAWLLNNQCPLPQSWIERLQIKLNELYNDNSTQDALDEEINAQAVKPNKTAIKTANAIKKIEENIAFIDNLIDDAVLNNQEANESAVYHRFTGEKLDEKIAKTIYAHLMLSHAKLNNEIADLTQLSQEQRIEQFDTIQVFDAYVNNIDKTIDATISVANQISSYLGNKKSLKKSERKLGSKHKAKRIEAQVQNLNFKVQDATYKVISINPTAIAESQTLLAFNTKSRKLAIYVASTDQGLSVRGTTIQNYDEEKSVQKIIKNKDMLAQIQSGNIRRAQVLLESIRAKFTQTTGRINEHTILLKVFKEKYGQQN